MALPNLTDLSGTEVASGAVGLAILWKAIIYWRQDARGDRKEEKQQAAYNGLIDRLEKEVGRQSTLITDLAARVDGEIARREASEKRYDTLWAENARLLEEAVRDRRRIAILEKSMRELDGNKMPPTTDDEAG